MLVLFVAIVTKVICEQVSGEFDLSKKGTLSQTTSVLTSTIKNKSSLLTDFEITIDFPINIQQ